MITHVLLIAGLFSLILGALLTLAQRYFKVSEDPLVERVNALLPQTQCGQCTFPGCKPYAEAIVKNQEAINKCPPGGEHTLKQLADLLGRDLISLDTTHGTHEGPKIVTIREHECIGCTLCIQACPVDAIVGAPKQMHTVIEDLCTGCDLCIPPCPVDCIDIKKLSETNA